MSAWTEWAKVLESIGKFSALLKVSQDGGALTDESKNIYDIMQEINNELAGPCLKYKLSTCCWNHYLLYTYLGTFDTLHTMIPI